MVPVAASAKVMLFVVLTVCLLYTSTNRVTGILSGALITAAVQSSTATTVMTVSFVNAGLLTLAQAISVIMGANIGTTLTAWIMSAGFSFNITDLSLIHISYRSNILLAQFCR